MTGILAQRLRREVGGAALLKGVDLQLQRGELVALIGPNGAGKTTLLRALLGLTPVQSGQIEIDGSLLSDLSVTARARLVSYLPQDQQLAWQSRVSDIVALGRFAYGAAPGRRSEADQDAIERAMQDCEISDHGERIVETLSGGERARVHFARAFAAQTPYLLADEPVAALDPAHQFRIMGLIENYVHGGGGAMVVMHDLNLAARYADRLIWMQSGEVVAQGSVTQTLTPERLAQVYGVRAEIGDGHIRLLGPL